MHVRINCVCGVKYEVVGKDGRARQGFYNMLMMCV